MNVNTRDIGDLYQKAKRFVMIGYDNYLFFDLSNVLTEMRTVSSKLNVLWAFRDDGYKIKESDIVEYHDCVGTDPVLKEMLMMYKGTFSKETIMDFCYSAEGIPISDLLKRLESGAVFSHDEAYDLLNSLDDKDLESHRCFFAVYNPDSMDEDSLREILDLIPKEAYKYAQKYLKLLPKEDGLYVWQDYFE